MTRSSSTFCRSQRCVSYQIHRLESRRLLSEGFDNVVGAEVFTDAALTSPGAIGSYINQSLWYDTTAGDWRIMQTVAGSRVDPSIRFPANGWGTRGAVGITGGSDANWDNFSVQWDAYLHVTEAGSRLSTHSDDGSRLWIDLNHDGVFDASGAELAVNRWRSGVTAGGADRSIPLPAGTYAIRVQYEEGGGDNFMLLQSDMLADHVVRVAYVIPSNRSARASVLAALDDGLPRFQNWFRDQMDRNGFVGKTFTYETLSDGMTPKIHIVPVAETDSYLRGDLWARTQTAARSVGVPVWDAGQVWLLVPEAHQQQPNGSTIGGVALGAGYGSGSGAGVAVCGSDGLTIATAFDLKDNRLYHGMIVPEFGPYPLVQDVSFPWFEGNTISSIASSHLGATLHELGHAFGLPHDFRNDDNFRGNLMGNGLRGFRGAFHPDAYAADDMYLSYGQALMLNTSRFFSAAQGYSDNQPPALSVLTAGAVAPVNGALRINFTASDSGSGLASAWLSRNGELIGELTLSGASASAFFTTPYYTPGTADNYSISVFDTQGNRVEAGVSITPGTPPNRAPQAFILASSTLPAPGEPVTLNASRSSDPGSTAALMVEWDLDGNGTFDTAPSLTLSLVTSFAQPGTRRIRARLTDAGGLQTVSTALGIRIQEPAPTLAGSAGNDTWYQRQVGSYVQVFAGTSAADPLVLSILRESITTLIINGGLGDDTLTVDRAPDATDSQPALSFSGAAGIDTLAIAGSALIADEASFNSDAVILAGATITHSSIETRTFDGLGDAAGDLLSVIAGIVTLAAPQKLAELNVFAAAVLDVRDHDVVINYGAVSPIGIWTGSAYDGITGYVKSGRIISSAAAAPLTTLGVAEAREALGITGSQTATFSGQSVDSTAVLVKFTWGGDATLDGKINIDDYGRIDGHVAQSGSVFGWFNGDFNLDGKINIDDYGIIDGNINQQDEIL